MLLTEENSRKRRENDQEENMRNRDLNDDSDHDKKQVLISYFFPFYSFPPQVVSIWILAYNLRPNFIDVYT